MEEKLYGGEYMPISDQIISDQTILQQTPCSKGCPRSQEEPDDTQYIENVILDILDSLNNLEKYLISHKPLGCSAFEFILENDIFPIHVSLSNILNVSKKGYCGFRV